jgi:diphosphomevalonate decarboxylase
MKWFAEAPSNIALIKYMGRKDEQKKIPSNPSLSYTLQHFNSFVELETSNKKNSQWEPLLSPNDSIPNALPLTLSSKAQERFLAHLQFIQKYLNYTGSFVVRSCNNFPQATGLASSASSFAALTRCAVQAISALTNQSQPPLEVIAQLSRQGSGSSCRSFYAPWALWDNESVRSIDLPYSDLIHQAIIISNQEKTMLSSQAHKQVQTSPFFIKRPERAENRLEQLLLALKNQDWSTAYQTTWDEFQDMHHLFKTSAPSFSYKNERSNIVLTQLQDFWDKHGDGPLVTMDAGPNIHLLYRLDQTETQQKIQQDYLNKLGLY